MAGGTVAGGLRSFYWLFALLFSQILFIVQVHAAGQYSLHVVHEIMSLTECYILL